MKYLFEKDYDENALMGDGYVNEAMYVKELQKHIKELESVIGSGKPVCPICKTAMHTVNYSGYYDHFSFWACECESFEDGHNTLGMYA